MKVEIRGDYVFCIEEIETLPDFPNIEKVIPVMTKEVFQECYRGWIVESTMGQVKQEGGVNDGEV